MVEITMQVSKSLATRIQSFGDWSATIIELSLADFQFQSAKEAATDLISFLSQNPSPQKVFNYFVSDKLQKRLDDLLDLNGEGEISELQKKELNEWMKINHISILLKASAGKLAKRQKQRLTAKRLAAVFKGGQVKRQQRSAAQKEIEVLNIKREAYIATEKAKNATNKNNAATLESEVEKIIKEQAKRFNMRIE